MKLVLAEKPSVAMSLSKVIGANQRGDGYMEGNGYLVSCCVGHLVELSQPEAALQLSEDDGDEDEEVDVNGDYEAESDDEPV